jgi:hypothetical protein
MFFTYARGLAGSNRILLLGRNQRFHLLAGMLMDLADLRALLLRGKRRVGANAGNLQPGVTLNSAALCHR